MTVFICTGNSGKLKEFNQALKGNILGINNLDNLTGQKYTEPLENSDYFISNAFIKLFSAIQYLVNNYSQNKNIEEISQIIVDDSGLCVPDLNYLPGVHSANFAGKPRCDIKNIQLLKSKIESSQSFKKYKDEKRLSAFFVCFLLSVEIKNIQNFKFTLDEDFSEASILLKNDAVKNKLIALENKLLKKINLNFKGGVLKEQVNISEFYANFPSNFYININCGYCCGQVSSKEQSNIKGAGHGYDPIFYSILNPDLSFASITLEEKNKISHRAFAISELKKI